MPRKRYKTNKRILVQPDPKYQSEMVAKFINSLMMGGKKDLARRIVYNSLEAAGKELEKPPVDVLNQALDNIRPSQEVRSRRVGGATFQVPMPVRRSRGNALAMRWLIKAARSHPKTMEKNLSQELVAAYKGEGAAIKKKEDVHRMADANRAFAHFRW